MADQGLRPVDRRRLLQGLGAGAVASLAGCVGGGNSADGSGSGEETGDAEGEDETPEPQAVDVAETATWRTATLEDATTESDFRINDLEQPVVLHTFAIGCAVCREQHKAFDAISEAGSDVALVDLTTDPYESAEAVREHAEEEGYDWRFGVSPEEVTGTLTRDFGEEVTVSARSPLILVCPDDSTYRLEKIVRADALETVLAETC